jgi:outer membrane phospholipase A
MKQSSLLLPILTLLFATTLRAECSRVDSSPSESREPVQQPDSEDLAARLGVSSYDPIYFILGGDGGLNSKFQISFKYQMFREDGWFARCLRIPSHIFLSYSQTSLWDLSERSEPFKDSSYRPRVFYLQEFRAEDSHWRFDLEGGLAHESNGKAEADSRSLNMAYLRPSLSYYVDARNRFYLTPTFVSYIDNSENERVADYRGYVDWLIGYGSGNTGIQDWNVWAILRRGTHGHNGSVELNVAVPFRAITANQMNGWFLIQYFNGHGESLIDYDRKLESQVRAGFAILVQ